ncbi:MAG: DUF4253 domain-containing protein [Clostridia bacterium]|nr:DUF4253 domain-containing protein [Clostridia bacterium]
MNLFDDIYNKRAIKKAQDGFTAALDALGYPYRLLEGGMDDGGIMALYARELEKGASEGYFPVLLPYEPRLFELIEQNRAQGEPSEAILGGAAVFAKRLEECALSKRDNCGENPSEHPIKGFSALDRFALLFTEYTNSFRMSALMLLPTAKPWEAALFLPFGGRNECPAPREMAAMLKKWHESFGAVPAVFAGDALEIFIPRPLDETELREAAGETAAFAGRAYDGSAEALSRFVKETRNKCVWHFTWG